MAKIGVVHTSLNSLGGAEKLCIEIVRALKETGNTVDLIVTRKTNWNRIKNIFGVYTYADRELVVHPIVSLPTIYSEIANWFSRDIFYVPRLKKNYDLTITTKPLFPIIFTDVVYMHFLNFPGLLEIYYKKYQSTIWKIYKFPYDVLLEMCAKIFNHLHFKPIILTNSLFSKHLIMKYLDIVPIVVYPPVDVEKYLPLNKGKERKNIILTISRIEEGKGLEIIPKLALKVSNAEFVIIGTLSTDRYLRNLQKLSKSLCVDDRVKIIPNASENVKLIYLSKSKLYLHPMRYEHFGIAIVEAMASGLVPLVSKTGGPWVDILGCRQGIYGYAYEDIDSCAFYANLLLSKNHIREEIVKRARDRSKMFCSEVFSHQIIDLVRRLLK